MDHPQWIPIWRVMDPYDVGCPRYCPACARPLLDFRSTLNSRHSTLDVEFAGSLDDLDPDEWRCSCCERVWIDCPCTPASEGECRNYYTCTPASVGGSDTAESL
jgi:hypothetical protein